MERLPAFRDFYPEPVPNSDAWSADARQFIFNRWRQTARRYGFREYDGPPLEPLELYTTKSGAEIVGQLYNFVDKGDRAVAMRPEMTPTLARMVAAHVRNYKKPLKWFAIPQLFRYERQQKGRLREHFQFNADILEEAADPRNPRPSDSEPQFKTAADAELLALLIDTLRGFGLTQEDFVIRLSSRNAWQQYYQQRQGDPARAYDFYQVVDKLERESEAESAQKLQALGMSLEDVRRFITAAEPTPELQAVLANLEARGLSAYVKIDYGVIRGLAYYTGVVFEAFDRKGELRAIAGGGRYDNLVELISGGRVKMPALGFGMGDVVLLELLKARKLLPAFTADIDVYCLVEDESLRAASLAAVQQWRESGLAVEFPLTAQKSNKQFERALELGARCTVRLERNGDAVLARLKHLATRQEQVLPVGEVQTSLK